MVTFKRKCLSEEKNAYIKYDKLVIDDDIYQYDSVKSVPDLVSR